jgi:phosphate transport system permease protein
MVGDQSISIHSQVNLRDHWQKAFEVTRFQRQLWDKAIVLILSLCAALVLSSLFLILTHLVHSGLSSVNFDFFVHLPKPVGEKGGGMANGIIGTLVLLMIAILIGVPIGLGSGIYLSEYANHRFAQLIRFLVDVMNGVPSIVFGIFAYIVCVLPFKTFSVLSGGFALGIMMIPMITRTSESFIRMVPSQLKEAGLAIGAPQWKVIVDIVLPSSIGGIMTGIMVALARVAGETAPLIFTAFGNSFWNHHLMQPTAALPLQIFSYAISPYDDWHRQAWAGAIVLILIVFSINLFASFFVSRHQQFLKGK